MLGVREVQIFRLALGAAQVPTVDLLERKNIPNYKWCPFCLHAKEEAVHIFVDC